MIFTMTLESSHREPFVFQGFRAAKTPAPQGAEPFNAVQRPLNVAFYGPWARGFAPRLRRGTKLGNGLTDFLLTNT